jgi:hypothetical protein
MRGDKASLANRYIRPGIAQAGRFNIRPDLAGAISGNGMDLKSVSLGKYSTGKSNDFVGFHVGSKTRQSKCRHAHEREYREGRKGSDHVGLLTVAGRQSRCAWGSVGNEAAATEFRKKRAYIALSAEIEAARALIARI